MTFPMLSQGMQDYLKAIYRLQERDGVVSTTALAHAMQVAAPSATGMVKKLAVLKLVRHQPYQGVVLSKTGAKVVPLNAPSVHPGAEPPRPVLATHDAAAEPVVLPSRPT